MGGGGLRLETSALPTGAELMVRFRTSKHQAFIQAKARVIYTLPDLGSGVEFTDITQEQLQMILKTIHGKTGNRRKTPRVPLATQIHIDGSMALAFSRDLSTGGIFIDTKEPSQIGTKVDLRFRLSENDPVIIAKGEVRYVVPKLGMGVQFSEISDEDQKRIVTFVLSSGDILPEPIPEGPPS
jgi:Tfp pilus assembly protein PilZ